MADFSAPSFSLGLDLDLDLDADLSTHEEPGGDTGGGRSPLPGASSSCSRRWLQEGEDEADGDPTMEEDPPASTPALKRLKRGPPLPRPPPADPPSPDAAVRFPALDDDIEEFSSQEERVIRDEYSSGRNQSACSSTKFSLHGQKILSTLSARKLKTPKVVTSNVSISTSVDASCNKRVFPRLTTSPLQRIQLLDSDSDDLSISEDICKDVKDVDTCPPTGFSSAQCLSGAQPKKIESSSVKLQSGSLWKDFSPKKNFDLATPALDEFCKEYFKPVKFPNVCEWSKDTKQHPSVPNSGVPLPDDFADEAECHREKSCITNSPEHCWNLPDHQPSSYQYFYHGDVRIQNLVRQRLPNFIPIGDVKFIGSQQPHAGALDYMSQFGLGKETCQVLGSGQKGLELGSKGRPRNRKNAKGKEVAETSVAMVNPRSSNTIPKDAGRRRVHADVHSLGHWYTGQDGKKVYVTRNGEELSGRIGYKQYIKESGARFRKSRKKAASSSRKKTAGSSKKKAAGSSKKKAKR